MYNNSINLRPNIGIIYPPNNFELFEEFFFKKYIIDKPKLSREYLPIYWTSFYVNKNYGNGDLTEAQNFLDSLDKSKKYFTIVQYDDCILNDLKDIDILIFNQGGYGKYREKCYPIPLNCQPPATLQQHQKDIFCSFIGTINGRHRIREKLAKTLENDKKYLISELAGYDTFNNVLSKTLFSLCPRGYGQTSFRICESLQRGSIPVYVYDDPLIPFADKINFSEYGILIHENEIENLDKILTSISKEKIDVLLNNGKAVYARFYQYDGCYKEIINATVF